jgi:hypothetical protein
MVSRPSQTTTYSMIPFIYPVPLPAHARKKGLGVRFPVHPATLINAFKHNFVPNLSPTLSRRPRRELQRPSSPEYYRRYPPRLQPRIDPDNPIATSEKNDIDRKTHEEHVHPHKRREAPVVEQHPGAGFETVATQQSAPLARETTGILEPRAQHGPASFIDCSNEGLVRQRRVRRLGLSHYVIM